MADISEVFRSIADRMPAICIGAAIFLWGLSTLTASSGDIETTYFLRSMAVTLLVVGALLEVRSFLRKRGR